MRLVLMLIAPRLSCTGIHLLTVPFCNECSTPHVLHLLEKIGDMALQFDPDTDRVTVEYFSQVTLSHLQDPLADRASNVK
jgi:hypothetical protein